MNKQIILTAITAIFFSAATYVGLSYVNANEPQEIRINHVSENPVKGAMYTVDDEGKVIPMDFESTAARVMPSVVYIQSTIKQERDPRMEQLDPFRRFFEGEGFPFGNIQPRQPQYSVGSGSGVIINEKGYIVTNNHVIDGAKDIEVTLNDNRSYKATVVGTDPSTDLALLQIKAEDLEALPIVNSDQVNVGQWVMAVGNPFNLTSTVTAGIVSAKARNININSDKYAIESFIQTDAAINRGNSGGALVNLEGQLIGINTAIMSPTGTYSGYGFAVPSNIVNKVIEDLLEYGAVQRAYLGVMIRDIQSEDVEKYELDFNEGVLVDSVMQASAAADAGLQSKDIIVAINGIEISTTPELQEKIGAQRPGDEVVVTVVRAGNTKEIVVTLKGQDGKKEIEASSMLLSKLGIDVQNLSEKDKNALDIDHGVKVTGINSGIVSRNTTMKEGFIITHLNESKIKDKDDFIKKLESIQGGVLVEGYYKDYPGKQFYGFGLDS